MGDHRQRYKGGDAPIIALFQQHIRDARHVFYPTQKGARRAPNYLVRHRSLINGLYALQSNLSFMSSQIQKCLDEFSKSYDWWCDAAEKTAWIDTMDKRVRKMCKDSREGLQKNPKAPWVRSLFEEPKQADDDHGDHEKGGDKGGKDDCDDEDDGNGDQNASCEDEPAPAHEPAEELAQDLVQELTMTDLSDRAEEVPWDLAPARVAKDYFLGPLVPCLAKSGPMPRLGARYRDMRWRSDGRHDGRHVFRRTGNPLSGRGEFVALVVWDVLLSTCCLEPVGQHVLAARLNTTSRQKVNPSSRYYSSSGVRPRKE